MSSAALRDGVLAVPVIDISSFRMPYADAAARSEVVRQVDEAARTVGFMQITGHGITAATRNEFTRATDAFFALDMETKKQVPLPAGRQPGLHPAEGGVARQQPRPGERGRSVRGDQRRRQRRRLPRP